MKSATEIIQKEIELCDEFVNEVYKERKTQLTYRAMVMREVKSVLERIKGELNT